MRRIIALLLVGAACNVFPDSLTVDPVRAATCKNGIRDGDETAVDCGGSCGKCSGDTCASSTDCRSARCEVGTCVGDPGPSSGARDGDETDVDCGGPTAPGCAAGKACNGDADCADRYCPEATPRVCVTPRNDDGVKNGTETDVDCGGSSGIRCPVGSACLADGDCTTACNYAQRCVEAPSCKPQYGGDTCGRGELEDGNKAHESCCKTLRVPGFADPLRPGKEVYLDKYEVTAGRVRAFIEDITQKSGGEPNVKAWVQANRPAVWDPSFEFVLPSANEAAVETLPRASLGGYTVPSPSNVGLFYNFASTRYVYVHGENCFHGPGTYGYSTFFYPEDVMARSGGAPRGVPRGVVAPFAPLAVGAKEQLDMKSMNCIPAAMLAAFCHWDGGQLATDAVLDFVTNAPSSLGSGAGCGTRCAPVNQVQATADSGSEAGIVYYYPSYNETSEGVSRVAAPGRVVGDVVRIGPGDEPWMDLHGNLHEMALAMSGSRFEGEFTLKYRGLGFSSARALANATALRHPEYKAAYSGGRCMRFK